MQQENIIMKLLHDMHIFSINLTEAQTEELLSINVSFYGVFVKALCEHCNYE